MTSPESAKCTIITPAYNAERFIGETIQSVRRQTYSDWEMIIVDDCSKDDTFKVASAYAENDRRIKVIAHTLSKGPSGARNSALLNANGRFIAFLDSDDLWLPEKLDTQIAFMSSTR